MLGDLRLSGGVLIHKGGHLDRLDTYAHVNRASSFGLATDITMATLKSSASRNFVKNIDLRRVARSFATERGTEGRRKLEVRLDDL